MSESPTPTDPIQAVKQYRPRLPHVTPAELRMFYNCSESTAQNKMGYLRSVLGKTKLPQMKKKWQRVTWVEAEPYL